MLGAGYWLGGGLVLSAGLTDGHLVSGRTDTYHIEANYGEGPSFGGSFDKSILGDDMSFGAAKGGPGAGLMAGQGLSIQYTLASPTLGETIDAVINYSRSDCNRKHR